MRKSLKLPETNRQAYRHTNKHTDVVSNLKKKRDERCESSQDNGGMASQTVASGFYSGRRGLSVDEDNR